MTITLTDTEAKLVTEIIENVPALHRGVDLANLLDRLNRQIYSNYYPSPQGEPPAGQMHLPGLEGY